MSRHIRKSPAPSEADPNPELTTEHVLIAVFRGPVVRLTDICEGYFGLGPSEAIRSAIRQELPIPVFRLRDSQKAPLLVMCADLAKLIDRRRMHDV
jgi:hypothetical protein